ncbi:MAG: hypothetical protein Q4F05_02485 [bacterium]|nr:hypothetical protein [bacterium]
MKYTVVSLRMETEEKEALEQESFHSGLSISDIVRVGLKMYFKNHASFETTQEKRKKAWRI